MKISREKGDALPLWRRWLRLVVREIPERLLRLLVAESMEQLGSKRWPQQGDAVPSSKVFDKYKSGALHSGSKSGPVVKNRKQAIAIYLSEKRAEDANSGVYPERKRPTRKK